MRRGTRVSTLHGACIESSLARPSAGFDLAEQAPATGLELPAVLEQLQQQLGAQNVVAYRPEIYEQGWDLEFSCWVGTASESRELAHRRFVQRSDPDQPTFAAYDPFAVQEAQQNRALTNQSLFALEQVAESRHGRLYRVLQADETQQLRMLVCEGPRLLGWVGVLREAPYLQHEVALLQSLAEPLRRPYLSLFGQPIAPTYEDWLRALISQAEFESWSGLGHFLHLVEPARFSERVRQFVG